MYFVATNQVGELEAEKVWQARQSYHVIGRDGVIAPVGTVAARDNGDRRARQDAEGAARGASLEGDMLGPGRQTGTSAANWIASPYRCQV